MDEPLHDPRAELAEVAIQTRSRVRQQNLRHPLSVEPFDQVIGFTRDGRKIRWATNGRSFLIEAEASSAIVFAAGRPDTILGASSLSAMVGEVMIFSIEGFSPTAWLSLPGHSSLVTALGLTQSEQLLVARNRATLMAEPRGIDADWKRLADLLEFVAALPADALPEGSGELIDGLRFDAAEVEPELQQLLPMLRRWAVGDDTERSDRIAAASADDLQALVQTVEPELRRINALIDSQDEPLSDEAVLLGNLAEAADEALRELNTRLGQ